MGTSLVKIATRLRSGSKSDKLPVDKCPDRIANKMGHADAEITPAPILNIMLLLGDLTKQRL